MNGTIFVCSDIVPVSCEPVKNGAVAASGGKITAVGGAEEIKKSFPDFTVRDLGRGVVAPGFINCHTHLELGWLKPEKKFKSFTSWLKHIIDGKSSGANTGKIERSVTDGIKSLIQSGVTTVGEISSYGNDADILKNSPLRTVLFREIMDNRPDTDTQTEPSERFEERLFAHAPYSCGPELIEKVFKISARGNIPTGIHLAESPEETAFVKGEKNGFEETIYPLIGKPPMKRHKAETPFQYLRAIESGGAKITGVHMAHIKKSEIKQIQKTGMGVVLCPRSNEFLGTGTAPVPEYAEMERIGLGTDGLSSNTTLNFFDEIKALYKLLLPLGENTAAEKAVRIATLGGAEALFMEDKIGSIETGKDSDLIFIECGETENPYLEIVKANKAEVL
ncbi:MAG: amidohydrolase family protein [Candidatus Mycalebacterium zealandia]|nr:MAG: amidohydrolase family protein [Candidatus Mycalebacterium zealandia]